MTGVKMPKFVDIEAIRKEHKIVPVKKLRDAMVLYALRVAKGNEHLAAQLAGVSRGNLRKILSSHREKSA